MKAVNLLLLGAILIGAAGAQDPAKPMLRKGVSVQMPTADHAVEMRAADEENATVVAITAEGKLYLGIQPTEPGALSSLPASTVYVKADSRAPFQKVIAVLDALRGKSVVLLAAPPKSPAKGNITPPYGIQLTVSR
jgi:biopolymer transport protein ExbD